MKKIIAAAFLLAALSAPASAAPSTQQAKGYYAEFLMSAAFVDNSDVDNLKTSGGASVPTVIDFDNTFQFEGAFGRDFGDFRLDASIGHMQTDIKNMTSRGVGYEGSGSFSMVPLLLSAYYDVRTSSPVKPFLGAGAGMAYVFFDTPRNAMAFGSDESATVPAFHVTLGTAYQINPQLGLTASYRYLWTGEGEFSGYSATEGTSEKIKASFGSHLARIGFRFGF